MNAGTLTESMVAKKDQSSKKPVEPEPPFERLEFQAPPGFTARLDEARKKRGLSRSAYIRQAVLLLIEEDTPSDA